MKKKGAAIPLFIGVWLLTACGGLHTMGDVGASVVDGVGTATKSVFFLPVWATAEVGSLQWTGKTVEDHLLSWQKGKDCSSVRLQKGQTYCKEDAPRVIMRQSGQYCYRDLGGIACYEAEQLGRRQVAELPPYLSYGAASISSD